PSLGGPAGTGRGPASQSRTTTRHCACETGAVILLPVDDPADPRLDDYRRLTDTALRRRTEPENGLYIAESLKVIQRALAAGHRPRSIMTQRRWLPAVEDLLAGDEVPVLLVPDQVAEGVTG